ncbi:MAG TPA: helix-turn-helix transcriptional regulator [Dehalococcoidia bacterium]|nr:helix-turn-helix transcriptional regulator [Dehalococcoidia bacterium]
MVDEPQYGSGSVEDPDAHDPKKTALGARLRAARMHVAMTQEDLAARVQRKKNWLSDIERGRRGIDPHTLQEIAQITGRPVEYFTNPRYDEQRRRQLNRPATREDWDLLYAGDPERAAAHASLDDAFDRARALLDPPPDDRGSSF